MVITMTDNDVQTRPVPHQAATVHDREVRHGDPLGARPPASYQVVGNGSGGPFAGASAAADQGGEVTRRPTVMDRIRTPVAAVIGGGILILGVGFGAGFAVGHSMGGGEAASQTGPGGQGFAGPGMGGPGGGTNPFGQGQTGQGQMGQGQMGQGQTGQGTTTSFAA